MSCAALYRTKIEASRRTHDSTSSDGAVACVSRSVAVMAAQTKTVPRPPAQPQGQQPPGESAAPDGYQPLPAWLGPDARARAREDRDRSPSTRSLTGSTARGSVPARRPHPARRAHGGIRIVGKDGKAGAPLAGMPPNVFTQGAGAVLGAARQRLRDQPDDLLHLLRCCRPEPIRRRSARPRTCTWPARRSRPTTRASKA
jgi:hypothetical protein